MLDRARLAAIIRRAGEIAMSQWPIDNKALEVLGKWTERRYRRPIWRSMPFFAAS
jgi:hypothetical protein